MKNNQQRKLDVASTTGNTASTGNVNNILFSYQ